MESLFFVDSEIFRAYHDISTLDCIKALIMAAAMYQSFWYMAALIYESFDTWQGLIFTSYQGYYGKKKLDRKSIQTGVEM